MNNIDKLVPKSPNGLWTELEFKSFSEVHNQKSIYESGGTIRGKVRVSKKNNGTKPSISIWFRYRYKFQGRLKDVSLGTWPKTPLKEIRSLASQAKLDLESRIDPAAKKKADKLEKVISQTNELSALEGQRNDQLVSQKRIKVNELFNRWGKLDLINHKDKGQAIRRLFEKDVLPRIGDIAVADVKKSDVMSVIDSLLERKVDRTAKMTLSLIRQMFRFAQTRDLIDIEPTASIPKSKIGKPDTERDRVLSEDEIKELYKKIPSAHMTVPAEAAIWIALSTGCRIGEILKAKWGDIDLEKKTWLIPPENSKNGDALEIYLSSFAKKQFEKLKSINNSIIWCYPNRENNNHVCPKTITKQIIDRQLGDVGNIQKNPMNGRSKHTKALILSGGKWTPHDLRRTAGTLMTALGVLPDIADKCLNHKEQNRIRRTYLRHNYENEKREAWRLLGDRLDILTNTQATNVSTLINKVA